MEEDTFDWETFDRRIRRTKRFLRWLIDGQFQHGISPLKFKNLTAEQVEKMHNVDFGN